MIREMLDHSPAATAEWTFDGLALMTAMIGSEVYGTATRAQADAFFGAVGRRIASLLQVGDIADADTLMARINRLWQALGWGTAHLQMTEDAILIHHVGLPETLEGDVDGRWSDMAPPVLRGAYDSWFRALGGGDHLHISVIHWRDGVMELRYGV